MVFGPSGLRSGVPVQSPQPFQGKRAEDQGTIGKEGLVEPLLSRESPLAIQSQPQVHPAPDTCLKALKQLRDIELSFPHLTQVRSHQAMLQRFCDFAAAHGLEIISIKLVGSDAWKKVGALHCKDYMKEKYPSLKGPLEKVNVSPIDQQTHDVDIIIRYRPLRKDAPSLEEALFSDFIHGFHREISFSVNYLYRPPKTFKGLETLICELANPRNRENIRYIRLDAELPWVNERTIREADLEKLIDFIKNNGNFVALALEHKEALLKSLFLTVFNKTYDQLREIVGVKNPPFFNYYHIFKTGAQGAAKDRFTFSCRDKEGRLYEFSLIRFQEVKNPAPDRRVKFQELAIDLLPAMEDVSKATLIVSDQAIHDKLFGQLYWENLPFANENDFAFHCYSVAQGLTCPQPGAESYLTSLTRDKNISNTLNERLVGRHSPPMHLLAYYFHASSLLLEKGYKTDVWATLPAHQIDRRSLSPIEASLLDAKDFPTLHALIQEFQYWFLLTSNEQRGNGPFQAQLTAHNCYPAVQVGINGYFLLFPLDPLRSLSELMQLSPASLKAVENLSEVWGVHELYGFDEDSQLFQNRSQLQIDALRWIYQIQSCLQSKHPFLQQRGFHHLLACHKLYPSDLSSHLLIYYSVFFISRSREQHKQKITEQTHQAFANLQPPLSMAGLSAIFTSLENLIAAEQLKLEEMSQWIGALLKENHPRLNQIAESLWIEFSHYLGEPEEVVKGFAFIHEQMLTSPLVAIRMAISFKKLGLGTKAQWNSCVESLLHASLAIKGNAEVPYDYELADLIVWRRSLNAAAQIDQAIQAFAWEQLASGHHERIFRFMLILERLQQPVPEAFLRASHLYRDLAAGNAVSLPQTLGFLRSNPEESLFNPIAQKVKENYPAVHSDLIPIYLDRLKMIPDAQKALDTLKAWDAARLLPNTEKACELWLHCLSRFSENALKAQPVQALEMLKRSSRPNLVLDKTQDAKVRKIIREAIKDKSALEEALELLNALQYPQDALWADILEAIAKLDDLVLHKKAWEMASKRQPNVQRLADFQLCLEWLRFEAALHSLLFSLYFHQTHEYHKTVLQRLEEAVSPSPVNDLHPAKCIPILRLKAFLSPFCGRIVNANPQESLEEVLRKVFQHQTALSALADKRKALSAKGVLDYTVAKTLCYSNDRTLIEYSSVLFERALSGEIPVRDIQQEHFDAYILILYRFCLIQDSCPKPVLESLAKVGTSFPKGKFEVLPLLAVLSQFYDTQLLALAYEMGIDRLKLPIDNAQYSIEIYLALIDSLFHIPCPTRVKAARGLFQHPFVQRNLEPQDKQRIGLQLGRSDIEPLFTQDSQLPHLAQEFWTLFQEIANTYIVPGKREVGEGDRACRYWIQSIRMIGDPLSHSGEGIFIYAAISQLEFILGEGRGLTEEQGTAILNKVHDFLVKVADRYHIEFPTTTRQKQYTREDYESFLFAALKIEIADEQTFGLSFTYLLEIFLLYVKTYPKKNKSMQFLRSYIFHRQAQTGFYEFMHSFCCAKMVIKLIDNTPTHDQVEDLFQWLLYTCAISNELQNVAVGVRAKKTQELLHLLLDMNLPNATLRATKIIFNVPTLLHPLHLYATPFRNTIQGQLTWIKKIFENIKARALSIEDARTVHYLLVNLPHLFNLDRSSWYLFKDLLEASKRVLATDPQLLHDQHVAMKVFEITLKLLHTPFGILFHDEAEFMSNYYLPLMPYMTAWFHNAMAPFERKPLYTIDDFHKFQECKDNVVNFYDSLMPITNEHLHFCLIQHWTALQDIFTMMILLPEAGQEHLISKEILDDFRKFLQQGKQLGCITLLK